MAFFCFLGGLFLGGITMMIVMSCIQVGARSDLNKDKAKDDTGSP